MKLGPVSSGVARRAALVVCRSLAGVIKVYQLMTRPRLRTLAAHVCRMDTAVDASTSFAHGLRVCRDAAAAIAEVVLGCRSVCDPHESCGIADGIRTIP